MAHRYLTEIRELEHLLSRPGEVGLEGFDHRQLRQHLARLRAQRDRLEQRFSQTATGDGAADPIDAHLYHFTDSRNLPSMRAHGILSLRRLKRSDTRFIPASTERSQAADVAHHLDDYVRLCLAQAHPMAWRAFRAGRIHSVAWIVVDATAADEASTLFSNTNAAASRAVVDSRPATALNGDEQAEVLVKGAIAPELFVAVIDPCEERRG